MDTRPRNSPEDLLEDYEPYFHLTPEERDRIIQSLCKTALNQLAGRDIKDVWRPPEPPPCAEVIFRKWMHDLRAGRSDR